VEVLYHLGPAALPATETLLECYKRPEHEALRKRMLQVIGHSVPWHPDHVKQTHEALCRLSQDRALANARTSVWEVLSRLQFDASGNQAALLAGLSHQHGFVRTLAAEALELLVRRGIEPDARPALVAALKAAMQDSPPTRFTISYTWSGGAGSVSTSFNQKDAVQAALARVLLLLEPTSPETVPGHQQMLTHLDPRVRQEAARGLGMLAAAAGEAAATLVPVLDDPEPAVAREAATALGLIGRNDDAVRQGLERAAASADKQLAARARAALTQLARTGR
jgi:HEAT repeat protein